MSIATPAAVPAGERPPAADPRAASRAARTRLLLDGPIGPVLARMAAPNVLAMGVSALVSINEAFFAGLLGLEALAGLALVFPLVMLTQMLSAGAMGGATSAAIARALGAGAQARAERTALAGLLIAAALAGLTALAVARGGAPLFAALGGHGGALAAALAYAGVFFPGCIAMWLCNAALSIIRGTGQMALASGLLALASGLVVALSGALSQGWGPLPALGMAGLAAGQVGGYALAGLAALALIGAGGTGLRLQGAWRAVGRRHLGAILRVGLFSSINAVQTVTTIVLMTGLVGRFGPEALAGYGLGARLEFLMIPVVFGIGAALTAMVGANIGAGARDRALRVAWTGALAAAAIVGAIGALAALAPGLWLDLFLPDEAAGARAAGALYFRIIGPFYGFFALGLALYFASQGAERMVWPVVASLVRLALAFGGALALLSLGGPRLEAVFAAIAAGMCAYGIVTAGAIALSRWR